jgi:preprotein translocase subunit YajC
VTETTTVQLAQASDGASDDGGGLFGSPFILLIAMLLLMYALIIRPQQRQQKEHKQMVSAVERGDMVVTTGGIHGKVTGVADDILTVEIADRVRVKVNRSAVASRASTENKAADKKEAKS